MAAAKQGKRKRPPDWVRRAKARMAELGWSVPRLASEMDNLSQITVVDGRVTEITETR